MCELCNLFPELYKSLLTQSNTFTLILITIITKTIIMKRNLLNWVIALQLFVLPTTMFGQIAPDLKTTSNFVLFTAVGDLNNVGASVVTGDIGTHVGLITGIPNPPGPGTLVGNFYAADPGATQPAIDVATAYGHLSTVTCGKVLGTTLGNGQTLTPNVYCLGGASTLNGIDGGLILDGQGDPNALFIFKINGALTTDTYSNVTLINGASECNIYWQIDGIFSLGEHSVFSGTALVNGAINLLTGSKLHGRALSTSGAINTSNVEATMPTCNQKPPVPTITGPAAVCITSTENVYTTESGMTNYSWLVSAGGTITSGGTTTSSTVTVTWNTEGAQNVSVNYTNAYGSAGAAPTVYPVTLSAFPTAVITAGGATTFCQGNSVLLTSSEGTSYLWSTGATTQSITAITTGNYTVKVTTPGGCSATSTATTLTVSPLPTATITPAGEVAICGANSVVLSASQGTSYLWSNGATAKDISVSTLGDYTVAITNANGCSATSPATTVKLSPAANAVITTSGSTTICEGNSVILTASKNESYLWSNGATTQSITVTVAGNYSVVVTNICGDTKTSDLTSVTVNPLPSTATISPAGATTICEGNSVILTASSGSSYLWSNGATTQSITVSAAGNYSVTVANENGCSTTSIETTVAVNPLSIATITPNGPLTFCEGSSVVLTSSPGTIMWSTGETTQSITVIKSGDYSVTVTGGVGCSVTSPATTVSVTPMTRPVITANGSTNICQGNTVTLTSSSATSYLWSNGATTQSIAVSAAGDYSVTTSNGIGCTAISTAAPVTVIPLPTATITPNGETAFCEGGSVLLTASAGDSYIWSNGATTRSITAVQSGNYSVSVTDVNNCNAASAVQAVTVYPLPAVTINQLPSGVNITSPSIVLSALPTGGTFTGQGVTGNIFSPTAAGLGNKFITYTYTNENKCSNSVKNYILVYDTIGHVCIDTVHVIINDIVHVSVTDTLFIKVNFTGTSSLNDYNTIKVYPNPTSSHAYINTGNYSNMNGYKIKIINSVGQTVFQNNINKQLFDVDLTTFGVRGLYLIHILNPSGEILDTRKIILK